MNKLGVESLKDRKALRLGFRSSEVCRIKSKYSFETLGLQQVAQFWEGCRTLRGAVSWEEAVWCRLVVKFYIRVALPVC